MQPKRIMEKNVVVTGGSQGGALKIVTVGLEKRVTALAAFYPALIDLTGYLHERAGWPHMFTGSNPTEKGIAALKQLGITMWLIFPNRLQFRDFTPGSTMTMPALQHRSMLLLIRSVPQKKLS